MQDLEKLLQTAMAAGASKLLLMAGQPPLMRVRSELSPPLAPDPLHWEETEKLAEQFLAERMTRLDENGSAEVTFQVGGVSGDVTIFYGNGCHNLVFHLQPQNGSSKQQAHSR